MENRFILCLIFIIAILILLSSSIFAEEPPTGGGGSGGGLLGSSEYRNVTIGQNFDIIKIENTSYKWELDSYDQNYLGYDGSMTYLTCSSINCISSFGMFTALKNGETAIKIKKIDRNTSVTVEERTIYLIILSTILICA